jgi:hypothetical protein
MFKITMDSIKKESWKIWQTYSNIVILLKLQNILFAKIIVTHRNSVKPILIFISQS